MQLSPNQSHQPHTYSQWVGIPTDKHFSTKKMLVMVNKNAVKLDYSDTFPLILLRTIHLSSQILHYCCLFMDELIDQPDCQITCQPASLLRKIFNFNFVLFRFVSFRFVSI
jgi:hypothetical protein